MESNGSSSKTNKNHTSDSTADASKEKSSENEKDVFVNHAEIAWHQMRKEWVGDKSKRLQRPPKDSIMSNQEIACSLTTNYEDMLLSTEPFPQPIPLAEMVDFLVDFWHEEGLYD